MGNQGERTLNLKEEENLLISKIAQIAFNTKGIAALGKTLSEAIYTNILGRNSIHNGIKLSHNEDGYTIDIFVIVEYGVNIPSVSWELQENIKNTIDEIVSEKINAINVFIQGVNFPK